MSDLTLREHLEAIRRITGNGSLEKKHAVAALALLDATEREQRVTDWAECKWEHTDNRIVPDPEPSA